MHHGSGESGDASCLSMTVIGARDMPAASPSGGGEGLSNTITSSQGERNRTHLFPCPVVPLTWGMYDSEPREESLSAG